MQLIAFPGRLDSLQECIALASVAPSGWSSVLSEIEGLFEGSTASIDRLFVGRHDFVYLPSYGADCDLASNRSAGRGFLVDPTDYPRGSVFHLPQWPLCVGSSSRLALSQGGAAEPVHGVGVVLDWSGPWAWVVTVRVPAEVADGGTAAIAARIRQISAELCQAFAVSHGLVPEPYDRETIEAIWDRLSVGVVLFSARLQPLAANMAAHDALSSRRYFAPAVRGARLRAISGEDNDRLWNAAERILSGESERECLSIDGVSERQPLPIVFQSVRSRKTDDRSRLAGGTRGETFLALIGSWNVEDALRSRASA